MATTTSPPERLQKPNDQYVPWLLRRIWDRVNKHNEHFMGVVVGREGSGKSHTAIKIASEIDPLFNADQVLFDVVDLLEILRDREHTPGQFYVLDEAGVQLGRRTWQERGQVLTNQALQLIRNHNLGLVFTLPRLSELDSQAQGRLQAFLELIDKEPDEYVRGKWKWMNPDRTDKTGEIYTPLPRRRSNGRVNKVRTVAFKPPHQSLTEPYEARKRQFQERFYEQTIQEMRGDQTEDKSLKQIAVDIAKSGIENYVSRHSQTKKPYINKNLLRAERELSHDDAAAVKSLLERQFSEEELDELA